MQIGELILRCFHARTNAHVLHLTTRSFAAHKALNEFYDGVVELADEIAEAASADGLLRFPAVPYEPTTDATELLEWLDEDTRSCMKSMKTEQSHLRNLCEELRALIASTLYKLRYLE